MKHTWKKAAAGLMAMALVVGAAPANVGTGGLFGGTSITAYADVTETLLTTITGAGSNAPTATSANVSYSTEGIATLTFSGSVSYQASPAWGWWGYGWTATVTPAEGYTITKCVFYDDANRTATDSKAPFVVETTEEDKTPQVNGTPILANQSKGITKIEVYGYATPAAPTFSNASVTLSDDLALNFYVDGIADETAAAEYTVNFTGACVDESSALAYNATEGKYYATTHVYAKDIDKNITATLCKGDDTVDTVEDYSISQYLSSDAFSGADEKTSALITATKDFGNASSEYFYGTGSGYSDGFTSYAPDTSAYATTFDSDDAKLSLVLDSKTAARLYVKGDESGTESTVSATKEDYPTYHEVAGLLPQNLADEQTITVGGTDYMFSALTWCNRVLNNTSASTKNVNMAKAIMAYYEAAKNYNAPANPYAANSVGDLVTFGDYDWYIINKSDNGVTLLMQNNLMNKAYNNSETDVTWENCTLRTYLNDTFYNIFSDEDKAKIVKTSNTNPNNPDYSTSGGNNTEDYIYLLSIEEANALSDTIRANGSSWWLRSPGYKSDRAAVVYDDGNVLTRGYSVAREGGVRPALNLKF